jgi:hypothetical protein
MQKLIASATVIQDWLVDENLEFLDTLNQCVDVACRPTHSERLTCNECGYEADTEEFEFDETEE